jgi:adenylate kinase family enzyme
MCGIAGSGKTTFSQKIQAEYGFARLSIDEELLTTFLQGFEVPRDEGEIVIRELADDRAACRDCAAGNRQEPLRNLCWR